VGGGTVSHVHFRSGGGRERGPGNKDCKMIESFERPMSSPDRREEAGRENALADRGLAREK